MIFESAINLINTAILVGLLYSLFTIGLSISFRVLNYPDLTLEGSAIFGGAISFVFMSMGCGPIPSLIFGMLAGALAGVFTAIQHIYFGVSKLLSGIITTAVLYSINIRLLGNKANVRFTDFQGFFKSINPTGSSYIDIFLLALIIVFLILVIAIIFKTKLGLLLRSLGGNENFIIRLGYNPNLMVFIGLAIANSFIGLGGAILVHYKNYVDVNMSFGLLIGALAAMVLGETIITPKKIWQNTVSNILGTILYNFAIALVLFSWSPNWEKIIHASDVRLVTGLLLLLPIIIQKRKTEKFKLFKSDW